MKFSSKMGHVKVSETSRIITIAAVIWLQLLIVEGQAQFRASFMPKKLEMHMDTERTIFLNLTDIRVASDSFKFLVRANNRKLAFVDKVINSSDLDSITKNWVGSFQVKAEFLGETSVFVELVESNVTKEFSKDFVSLTVIRPVRVIDHVFTGSVALLVSLLYINFGAALDLRVVKDILRRPIGPVIGFIGQFVGMPLISYFLGMALFKDAVAMQLGLFFTGISPGGGASNIWSVLLQGNINLSIAMTTISNFSAFGMMPLWVFTLGKKIFDRGNLNVPYGQIATFAFSLIIPLAIGLLIQRFSPRITAILVRALKPVSAILIIFIVIFAIVTNLYLFELFSWQIAVAGLALPWIGYFMSFVIAKCLRQQSADALTIAIETGIQNTGVSIFLLRFSLPQPNADLTTVVPVAVAIMTPVPLLMLFIYQRIRGCRKHVKIPGNNLETDSPKTPDLPTIHSSSDHLNKYQA